jgi:hypothetical protein
MFVKHLYYPADSNRLQIPTNPERNTKPDVESLGSPQFHLFDGTAYPTATLRTTPSKAVLGLRTDTEPVGRSRQRSASAYQDGFVSAV